MAMTSARSAARLFTRRLSSGGKILSEEEKAAENIYIKKIEKEKLEKLAHQGPKPGEPTPSPPEAAAAAEKATSASGSSTAGVSTDKNRNYAVVAGVVTAACAAGWYFLSKPKKTEEVVD